MTDPKHYTDVHVQELVHVHNLNLITLQWNLSIVDTIGTDHCPHYRRVLNSECPDYRGVPLSLFQSPNYRVSILEMFHYTYIYNVV